MEIDPELIAKDPVLQDLLEKKRRKQLRSCLDAWARATGVEPAKHHSLINSELEKVEAGLVKKLMLFLPPGSAKSTYASVLFPPWFLSRRRDRAILACSHSADLGASFGRRCRETINLHYKELGYKLAKHSQAADRWETNNGGRYLSAGVGAGIAGYRADLGLIDDPIGKKEDADSKLIRDKIWDWYNYDFIPRSKPNASQVLIQTRWHEDDLAGRLLAREASEWRVVNLPLLAGESDPLGRAPGEVLWPEWFNAALVAEAQKDPARFNALYQQNPIPEDGNYFSREWIQEYGPSDLPSELRYYAASDHAVSQKQEADSTVILAAGVDAKDNIYILPDSLHGKWHTDEVIDLMLDINDRYKPVTWWAGRDHITASLGPYLTKRMMERRSYIPLIETPSSRDLSTRAQPIRGRMRTRKIFFPRYASWYPTALHELMSFPNGTHDDFVAALSELGRGLDNLMKVFPESTTAPEDFNAPQKLTHRWLSNQEKVRKFRQQQLTADR